MCRVPGDLQAGPSATPWVPPASEASGGTVAGQQGDPSSSLLALHRKLIEERRASPALRRGETSILAANGSSSDPLAIERSDTDNLRIAVFNFADAPNDLRIHPKTRELAFRDRLGGASYSRASGTDELLLSLPARGFVLLAPR